MFYSQFNHLPQSKSQLLYNRAMLKQLQPCKNQWSKLRLLKRKISNPKLKRRKSRKNSLLLTNSKTMDIHLDILTMCLRHSGLNHQFFMSFLKKSEMNYLLAQTYHHLIDHNLHKQANYNSNSLVLRNKRAIPLKFNNQDPKHSNLQPRFNNQHMLPLPKNQGQMLSSQQTSPRICAWNLFNSGREKFSSQ